MVKLPCLVFAASLTLVLATGCASLPVGQQGPAADALARRMEAAVGKDAWDRTAVVRWTFAGRNEHLWDKQRSWIRVRWDDCEVRRSLTAEIGRAWCDEREITDATRKQSLLEDAYAKWVNDAFWLNPLVKLFDAGVTRARLDTDDGPALLMTFGSGGLTPGDSYLWVLGPDDLPIYWRMWVSILPIRGVKSTWERWVTLPTGARISTLHESIVRLEITDLAAATDIMALEPEDPFPPK